MKSRFNEKKLIAIPLMILIFLVPMGFAVWALWNHVLTEVVPVGKINFCQALGILALSKILFTGGPWGNWGRHNVRKYGPWKMTQEKLANMSPDEREQFKAQWKDRCNRWGKKDNTPIAPSEEF